MTAPKTPSQRGTSNRRRGLTAERDLARWLRTVGFGGAERAVRTGFRTADRASADPGDITGTGPVVWSVKDCAVEQVSKWFAELDAMGDGDTEAYLLVHKRRGHASPARWWCWMTLGQLLDLTTEAHACQLRAVARDSNAPLRMELGDVVPLLRSAGHGDALEAAS